MSTKDQSNRSIAVFIDFENLALGFKDRQGRFEIKYVMKRLLEKGKIVAKKAYCDWSRFGSYTGLLHEAAIELVEIPKRSQTGKNSADIRLCVDAMDLAYSKNHIDTFVIVSGDSDFSPLVSKLKELGKHVIGLGMMDSTSALLRDNCDEFIYYEDLVPVSDTQTTIPLPASLSEARRNAFNLLFEALVALRRDGKEFLGAAMVKSTICRMHPGFDEGQFGYKSFSALLQDVAKEGLIDLTLHQKSGTWVVARFGDEMKTAPAPINTFVSPPITTASNLSIVSSQVSAPITTTSKATVTPPPVPSMIAAPQVTTPQHPTNQTSKVHSPVAAAAKTSDAPAEIKAQVPKSTGKNPVKIVTRPNHKQPVVVAAEPQELVQPVASPVKSSKAPSRKAAPVKSRKAPSK
jgi:uncharacterized protein (TIGR00288 family)